MTDIVTLYRAAVAAGRRIATNAQNRSYAGPPLSVANPLAGAPLRVTDAEFANTFQHAYAAALMGYDLSAGGASDPVGAVVLRGDALEFIESLGNDRRVSGGQVRAEYLAWDVQKDRMNNLIGATVGAWMQEHNIGTHELDDVLLYLDSHNLLAYLLDDPTQSNFTFGIWSGDWSQTGPEPGDSWTVNSNYDPADAIVAALDQALANGREWQGAADGLPTKSSWETEAEALATEESRRLRREEEWQQFLQDMDDFVHGRNIPGFPAIRSPISFSTGNGSYFAGWTSSGRSSNSDDIVVFAPDRVLRYANLYFNSRTDAPVDPANIWQRQGYQTTVLRVMPAATSNAEPVVEAVHIEDEDGEAGPLQPRVTIVPFALFGSIFGSNLARALNIENPWSALAAGTVLGTIGLNIGQAIDNATNGSAIIGLNDAGEAIRSQAFGDIGLDLLSAGAGAISSYLLAQWIEDIGVEGPAGEFTSSLAGAAVGKIIDNLALLARGVTQVEVAGQLVPLKPFAITSPANDNSRRGEGLAA